MRPNVLDSIDPRALGQRLQDARKARGITQEAVADLLGVARTTVTGIEKGERRLQPAELLRLAGLYGREVNDLLQQRPVTADFAVQFRLALGTAVPDGEEMEPFRFRFQELCSDYVELERLCGLPPIRKYPSEYDVRETKPDSAAEEIAANERERLGLGNGPVSGLRELLDNEVGLRIFEMDLPSRVAGFYVYSDDDLGACVAVNARHPEERRRWSLAHEYAHFLVSRFRPDITVLSGYQRVPQGERLADSFAARFLMPEVGLRRRVLERRRAPGGQFTAADLLLLAHSYHVSVEALANRLESLELIRAGALDLLRDKGLRARSAQETLGLPHAQPAQLLPQRYQYLAVRAFESATITEAQLARFLRCDRLEARELAERLATHTFLSDEGLVEDGVLDMTATLASRDVALGR